MDNKARYVLSQFNRIYGCDDLVVGYGLDQTARVRVRRTQTDYFDRRVPLDTTRVVWKEWKGKQIPFLFDDAERNVIEWSNNGAVVQYDILASAFYFLSGWQEFVEPDRDRYGRFPYARSIQRQLGIATVPVVNYYFDILRAAVEQAYARTLEVTPWPDAPFVTFLSHDVDRMSSAWKEEGFHALKRGRFLSPLALIWRKLAGRDAWFNLEDVLQVERQYRANSTFFFLPRKGPGGDRPNADYDIRRRRITSLVDRLETAGAEIGLHGSWGTHLSLEELQGDRHRLPVRISGNRFHFLNFDVVKTPRILEEAGISYDASLGFPEHHGFRNGCCTPFLLYDVDRDRPTNVLEIPLTLMDATLASDQNCAPEEAAGIFQSLASEARKFQGCVSVLWHNNYFSQHKYRGWGEAYRSILDMASRDKALFLTGRDIVERFGATPPAGNPSTS